MDKISIFQGDLTNIRQALAWQGLRIGDYLCGIFTVASVMLASVKQFAIKHVLDRLARALPHNAKYYLLKHSLAPERNALTSTLNREQPVQL